MDSDSIITLDYRYAYTKSDNVEDWIFINSYQVYPPKDNDALCEEIYKTIKEKYTGCGNFGG